MQRQLEPELMDDADEAVSYDDMNHSSANQKFVDDLLAGGDVGNDVLDLGTGTAQIPILLCERLPDCRVMAIDAAVSMLELALYNIELASATHQIQLMHGDAKAMDDFEDEMFDCVMSNSLIHHLPDPLPALAAAFRLTAPGGRVFIRDLLRPDSPEQVESLVATYAGNESPTAQQLLRQSLCASLNIDEIRDCADAAGLGTDAVAITSDRHWTIDLKKPKAT